MNNKWICKRGYPKCFLKQENRRSLNKTNTKRHAKIIQEFWDRCF